MTDLVFAFIAFLGVTVRALGYVLQRAGVGWFGYGGRKGREYYGLVSLWWTGFFLTNAAVLFTFVALRYLPAHLVSAVSGMLVVLLVIFSRIILKEPLFWQDYVFSLIIALAVAGIHAFPGTLVRTEGYGYPAVLLFSLAPLSLFIVLLIGSRMGRESRDTPGTAERIRPMLFALVAGSAGGSLLIIMKSVHVELGDLRIEYLAHPLLWLYLLNGSLSTVSIQIAFRRGIMALVVPVFYVSSFLYQVTGSFATFSSSIGALQILLYGIIVVAIIPILMRHLGTFRSERREGIRRPRPRPAAAGFEDATPAK